MIVENKFASFWIERGVLYFIYKEGVQIRLPAATQIVSDRLKLHKGRAYPVLCDINGVTDIDLGSRRYFANEGSVLLRAVALVGITPLSIMMSNMYLSGNSPPVPTKIFRFRKEALVFLSKYILY